MQVFAGKGAYECEGAYRGELLSISLVPLANLSPQKSLKKRMRYTQKWHVFYDSRCIGRRRRHNSVNEQCVNAWTPSKSTY